MAPFTRPGNGFHTTGKVCLANPGARYPFMNEYYQAAYVNTRKAPLARTT